MYDVKIITHQKNGAAGTLVKPCFSFHYYNLKGIEQNERIKSYVSLLSDDSVTEESLRCDIDRYVNNEGVTESDAIFKLVPIGRLTTKGIDGLGDCVSFIYKDHDCYITNDSGKIVFNLANC